MKYTRHFFGILLLYIHFQVSFILLIPYPSLCKNKTKKTLSGLPTVPIPNKEHELSQDDINGYYLCTFLSEVQNCGKDLICICTSVSVLRSGFIVAGRIHIHIL